MNIQNLLPIFLREGLRKRKGEVTMKLLMVFRWKRNRFKIFQRRSQQLGTVGHGREVYEVEKKPRQLVQMDRE